MAQELVAQAAALSRTFDETRDVGDDKLRGVEAHDAEVRLERRERIGGHLGLGRRDARDQRALARVRQPDEGDVGHQAQLHVEPALLPRLTLLGKGRYLRKIRYAIGRGGTEHTQLPLPDEFNMRPH